MNFLLYYEYYILVHHSSPNTNDEVTHSIVLSKREVYLYRTIKFHVKKILSQYTKIVITTEVMMKTFLVLLFSILVCVRSCQCASYLMTTGTF